MASLCKRQQCTIERRGFRQELDSWRHKLIHCVGFESILEGLFGQGLVKDFTLFQDCEPEALSDWSFDENCLFCCLRREKVKEHSESNSNSTASQVLSESEDFKINCLEKQAQDFLNAVFHRKDVPSFSDPRIPQVAREIMQRMIRQFAAEYTSKTSCTQDHPSRAPEPHLPNGAKDQSLPRAPGLAPGPGPVGPLCPLAQPAPASPSSSSSSSSSPSCSPSPTLGPGQSPTSTTGAAAAIAGPAASATGHGAGHGGGTGTGGAAARAAASAQNPVLSKLLMADQDSPLDLTVKRSDDQPSSHDGVLDLSTKKNSLGSGLLLRNSHGSSSVSKVKGRSLRVDQPIVDVDEEDRPLPRGQENGRRDAYVSSTSQKPPLARSLLIKEELLNQKQRLLNQPAALSLAGLESASLLNHGQSLLRWEGSSSLWGGKAQLDSLLKLKQSGGALSGALNDLKDLPLFLDNNHHHRSNNNHHHGAFSSKSSLHSNHHNQASKPHHHHHHHHAVKKEPGLSPPVDLKIPQVRGMDLSWDSHASDLYGYGAMVMSAGGLGENALSRKLRAILPKQNRRGSGGGGGGSLGGLLDGAADYWSSDVEQSTSGRPYPTSDAEGDPGSKQPRKKRGRYRQYNSEILEEAIAVVMGGKMSVSKAQNIYGIPHSTLEYKVKERLGTLKNPPKKKLKVIMRMEGGGAGGGGGGGGGQDSAAESENTPTDTPREDAPPLSVGELKDE